MDATCYEEMAELEGKHWWFLARRRIIRCVLDCIELQPDSTILEAGCGTGGNFPLLMEYGSLTALEPVKQARERAEARNIAHVVPGKLPDDISLRSESFDLVVLLDVLEHVEDDRAAMESLHELLKPEGIMVITVPAYSFLWSHHDEVVHHQRRYRRSTLKQLAQETNFIVRHATYFNTLLFPGIAATRWYRTFTGQKDGSDLKMAPPLINHLLAQVFASERFLVPHASIPFGVSILLILEKRDC